ncbi:MAG: protein arginine kinase [Candidatus Omnitrophica bacterium CG11_big_fil_rev_8_21_14_0_20_45_26]|uniref:Protein-arginine kinase n=1 Tax=Candidatus Abzuiibacterium crystallinum TaxID=1974748 RepID=A0A2H0LL86_9BACT|nr:MAG: protein arginine kinase [Candidatus Omnitrophica bacterium CG11_big_fil_rev_8_21_14_0_20_45_26]PIW63782.1 MAG: protein arginine kinase [Candidatus Omnitrophica bacterium CG12_big_fil_rev_8_21_14_0_65_45_16]
MSMPDPIKHLLTSHCEWLKGSGPESEVVISSRIRLARNIAGFNFLQKLSRGQESAMIDEVHGAVSKSKNLKDTFFIENKSIKEIDKTFLVERHLISRDHAAGKGEKAVVISPNEMVSIMVLEEDHLRLQVFHSGLNLTDSWRLINTIDTELEETLTYSFDPTLGYLTACPTNVGTGMRASCMLHLPALVMTKQINKVLQAVAKLSLAVRGLYGEGTQAIGNFFQFSNQITLGQNEEDIIDNIDRVIRQVIEHEKEARQYLLDKKRGKLEDQVWRALGALKSARLMASNEAIAHLSFIRLGVDLKLIEDLGLAELNSLFLCVHPAHLQKIFGEESSANERDYKRAELLRSRLKQVGLV